MANGEGRIYKCTGMLLLTLVGCGVFGRQSILGRIKSLCASVCSNPSCALRVYYWFTWLHALCWRPCLNKTLLACDGSFPTNILESVKPRVLWKGKT